MQKTMSKRVLNIATMLLLAPAAASAFLHQTPRNSSPTTQSCCDNTMAKAQVGSQSRSVGCLLQPSNEHDAPSATVVSRRSLFQRSAFVATAATATLFSPSLLFQSPQPAFAAERIPLDELLYRILRVREATQQEARLIKSGKFKDVQRANVKLAVKFMIDNYRLNDAFVGASAYLDGNNRRVEAGQVGQTAVQNLYTIMEYFDSSDVQNIKVGADSMAGKEAIVLKGLDATKKSIDDFLGYFPKDEVDQVNAKVLSENELNLKEFDKALGTLVNVPVST